MLLMFPCSVALMLLADSVTEESLVCSFVFKQPRQQEEKKKKRRSTKNCGEREMCHFSYSHRSLMECSLWLLFCVNRSDFISTWLVFYIVFFKNNQTEVLLLKLSHNGHQHLGIQVSNMSLLGGLLNDVCLSYHLELYLCGTLAALLLISAEVVEGRSYLWTLCLFFGV